MSRTEQYDKTQSRINAYTDLIKLMDELPVPLRIGFSDTYTDHVRVELSTAAGFEAWVAHLDAKVTYRDHRDSTDRYVQHHARADWNGWALYVCAVVRDPKPVAAHAEAVLSS